MAEATHKVGQAIPDLKFDQEHALAIVAIELPPPPLKLNEHGDKVKKLQYALEKIGFLKAGLVSGTFDAKTAKALGALQYDWGIKTSDGYDAPTRLAMAHALNGEHPPSNAHGLPAGTAQDVIDVADKYMGKAAATLESMRIIEPGISVTVCCANFVSSMLYRAGWIPNSARRTYVGDLNTVLLSRGWKKTGTPRRGDVWIYSTEHTELVQSVSHGTVTLVGSNNTEGGKGPQVVSTDSWSPLNCHPSWYLTPPVRDTVPPPAPAPTHPASSPKPAPAKPGHPEPAKPGHSTKPKPAKPGHPTKPEPAKPAPVTKPNPPVAETPGVHMIHGMRVPALAHFIGKHEGYRNDAYQDTSSHHYWTIGVGHKIEPGDTYIHDGKETRLTKDSKLSNAEVDALFAKDTPEYVNGARDAVGPDAFDRLDEARKIVCVDITYNFGVAGFPEYFGNFIALLRKGDFGAAGADLRAHTTWIAEVHPTRVDDDATAIEQGVLPFGDRSKSQVVSSATGVVGTSPAPAKPEPAKPPPAKPAPAKPATPEQPETTAPSQDAILHDGKELKLLKPPMHDVSGKGDAVRTVQGYLNLETSGVYDGPTEKAVRDWQGKNGVTVTGNVDANTLTRLGNDSDPGAKIVAKAQYYLKLGVAEQPLGSNSGPYIDGWLHNAGDKPGAAWCCAFATSIVAEAGYPLPFGVQGYCPTAHSLAHGAGLWVPNNGSNRPKPGWISLRDEGTDKDSHAMIVVSAASDQQTDISGNWGNRVSEVTTPYSDIDGWIKTY